MNTMKLRIVRPQFPDNPGFMDEFSACLDDGRVTNNGVHVQRFEAALSEYLFVDTVCLSSGTAALTAMLMASDVAGGEVICPSFTFPATVHAIIMAGARPVFADIKPTTLTLDPECVRTMITEKTRAIMPVDVYGIPAYDGEALRRADMPILFDSAPAFGSNCAGRPLGDAHAYSFHAAKPFSTMEGGCVCSDNDNFLDRVRAIRNFGLRPDGVSDVVGFNGKMMEVCALIGLENLKTWKETAEKRRLNASKLRVALYGIPGIDAIGDRNWWESIWTYQPILVDPDKYGMTRDALWAKLKWKEIDTRVYYRSCHTMPAFAKHFRFRTLPVTERVASQVLALPVYNDMTDEEINYLARAIADNAAHKSVHVANIKEWAGNKWNEMW